jgi:hypothetical protein
METSHAQPPCTSLYRHCITSFSQALVDAPTCFQRERKLGPLQVMMTMQSAHCFGPQSGGQSWEDALASLASEFGEDSAWGKRFCASRAAFQKAVKKVDDEAQSKLWAMGQKLFPAGARSTLVELHGVRFAHVDGTQVRMPHSEELVDIVGVQTNGSSTSSHFPTGKCVLVLEAGTQRVLGHELCRCKDFANEKEPVLAREERDGWRQLQEKVLKTHAIIADCGFASHGDFADMIDRKQHFVVAIPRSWKLVRMFKVRRKSDAIMTVPVPHHPGRTLTVRVFTIKDSDRKIRYIATSLDQPFTLSECRQLYKTRWGIETWFRYAKQFLGMRRLRSNSLHGVHLEILAILILMQAVAAIRTRIAKTINPIVNLLDSLNKGFRKAKFSTALRTAWRIICLALTTPTHDTPPPSFRRLLENTVQYRPNRSNPRISKDPNGLFMPKRPSKSQRKALRKSRIF